MTWTRPRTGYARRASPARRSAKGATRTRARSRSWSTGNVGALVELNCETDFVAKGDVFRRAVTGLTDLVRAQGDEDLANKSYEGATVDDFVNGLAGTLGEKIELGRVVRFETADGLLDAYKHVQNERGTGRRAWSSSAASTRRDAKAKEVAHDIALHIASSAPRFVSRDDVPADTVDRERTVLEAQTREEGKPEQALAQDRRREAQRVLQDGGAARAAVRQGPEDDDPSASSKVSAANAAVRRFARVKIGEE